jgi:molybdopterin-containing oxidoreductase family membrane subunit
MGVLRFVASAARYALRGGQFYWLWLAFLVTLVLWGAGAYYTQLVDGLIVTAMRDQVSWAFYIGNFTFLVGVAAAAVIVVIPAYLYHWKPLKEVVVLAEILAISALVMCFLFVLVDIGRPDRVWHLIPRLGLLNVPSSLLAWDVVALNGYLGLNVAIVSYVLYCAYHERAPREALFVPLVFLSIPAAIAIHTVTAFIYNGLVARPFWNASILAPRFIASAFCSGPAILLILFQILQRTTRLEIKDEAIWKVAELMAYAMAINLFLLGAEVFKEAYSATEHRVHMQYLFFGIEEHRALVPYAWTSVACSVVAFLLLLVPATRRHPVTLNLGCLLVYAGVYIEKGMGLVIPGMTPDTLGEIYEYVPTMVEVRVGAAIFSIGFLVYTLLTKVAVGILVGDLRARTAAPATVAGIAAAHRVGDAVSSG